VNKDTNLYRQNVGRPKLILVADNVNNSKNSDNSNNSSSISSLNRQKVSDEGVMSHSIIIHLKYLLPVLLMLP
jgi:hypothetical protein